MKFSGLAFAVVALSAASSVIAKCRQDREYCFESLNEKERNDAVKIMMAPPDIESADDVRGLSATLWRCTGSKIGRVELVKMCGNYCNRAYIYGKDKCEDSASASGLFHWKRV